MSTEYMNSNNKNKWTKVSTEAALFHSYKQHCPAQWIFGTGHNKGQVFASWSMHTTAMQPTLHSQKDWFWYILFNITANTK
jgi:hypothetical protein